MWSGLSMDRFLLVNSMVTGHAKDGTGWAWSKQHASTASENLCPVALSRPHFVGCGDQDLLRLVRGGGSGGRRLAGTGERAGAVAE
jgi:hypothetical protein